MIARRLVEDWSCRNADAGVDDRRLQRDRRCCQHANLDRIRPDMVPMETNKISEKKVGEARADYKTPVIYLTPLFFGEKGWKPTSSPTKAGCRR